MSEHTNPAPLGWQGGIDFEVTGTGPYEWVAYDEDMCVGRGRARTKIGLMLSIGRAGRQLRKEES